MSESPRSQTSNSHPEHKCGRCGGPNIVWVAPSPLWNAVMRGGCIRTELEERADVLRGLDWPSPPWADLLDGDNIGGP